MVGKNLLLLGRQQNHDPEIRTVYRLSGTELSVRPLAVVSRLFLPARARKEGGMNGTPLHVHLGWWSAWRDHVRNMKKDPTNQGYQYAAQLAQMEYLCYSAQYFGELR